MTPQLSCCSSLFTDAVSECGHVKVCDISLSTRYELLKHFRLKHIHYGSKCHFVGRSWKLEEPFESHISNTQEATNSTCSVNYILMSDVMCGCEELSTEKEYFIHTNQHLRQYENITCMFEGCTFQTNIYGTFNS